MVLMDQINALSYAHNYICVENVRLRTEQASTFNILEKFKTANILLNERLNAEQHGRIFFKNQFDACNYAYHQISEEHEKVRAELNHDELRKANQKSEQLKIQLTKTKHEARQEKEALQSLVDDLKIQLNQEKNDKDNGQDQVRKTRADAGERRDTPSQKPSRDALLRTRRPQQTPAKFSQNTTIPNIRG
ncbi:hypothetical protein WMY93_024432 [Mugilogobius chulae]|uniref:Uncharacterized protein n=1 Tax=Mugilogobius chulae TaxID=88201 RepID=A0AAW0N444_9GOBI